MSPGRCGGIGRAIEARRRGHAEAGLLRHRDVHLLIQPAAAQAMIEPDAEAEPEQQEAAAHRQRAAQTLPARTQRDRRLLQRYSGPAPQKKRQQLRASQTDEDGDGQVGRWSRSHRRRPYCVDLEPHIPQVMFLQELLRAWHSPTGRITTNPPNPRFHFRKGKFMFFR